MREKRNFFPCRVCGKTHTNPRSSSICPTCGEAEAAENRAREEAAEREKQTPVDAAVDAAWGFDENQRHALRAMFQAFYDALGQ